jgi:hypothetical protein
MSAAARRLRDNPADVADVVYSLILLDAYEDEEPVALTHEQCVLLGWAWVTGSWGDA